MRLSCRQVSLVVAFVILPLAKIYLQPPNLPAGFALVQIATNLDPVAMAFAPDGRLFIVEKHGRVRIVKNNQLKPEPFLELEVDIYSERGLLGIAFDPEFESNHYLYLYYTVKDSLHNRVSRFTADEDFAVPGSEKILLDLDPLSGPYHNAGAMLFGPDGKLFIAAGDGTNSDNSQSLNSLLGKILRINSDGSIPADNPFYQETSGKYRAIWTLGHRNPFAMCIQPGSGRIFTTDVGSDQYEEINEILKGKNYGWPLVEGFLKTQTPPANYQDPLHAYDHGEGCAAVGVSTYDPVEYVFPATYHGKIFFTELCQDKIKTLDPETGEVKTFATNLDTPINLLTAPDGTIYLLDRAGTQSDYSTTGGSLWRMVYTNSNAPFITVQPQNVFAPQMEPVNFSVSVAGAAPFQFQWQQNGQDIPGAESSSMVFTSPMLSDSGSLIRCIVKNTTGADTSKAALLLVTAGHRPEPLLLSPEEGAVYRGGEHLHLLAEAFDEEDGPLPPSAFKWRIDFHHDDHSHPAFGPVSNTTDEFYPIPAIGEVSDNVWYKVVLTVTDDSGLSRTMTRDVLPLKSNVILKTQPSGFPVFMDSHRKITPDTVRSVVGVFHQVNAPRSVLANDSLYLFKKWSTGQTDLTRLVAPPEEGLTLEAIYEAVLPAGKGEGLTGRYYDKTTTTFEFVEPPAFERIDPTVNFDWEYDSPDLALFGHDDFLIRWEGAIEPFFDEEYEFSLFYSDGARLWVDGQLIIDKWFNKAPTEHSGHISLEGGKKFPIRLEYYEDDALAACKLFWSSEKISKDIIPASQLYPEYVEDTLIINDLKFQVVPNPVRSKLFLKMENPQAGTITWELINSAGQLVKNGNESVLPGLNTVEVDLSQLPSGTYFLKISGPIISEIIKITKI